MAQVTVMIGGKSYRVACNEGEEPHLEGLAANVDAKVKEMRAAFGEIGDQRLIVMAALTIADELSEARKAAGAWEGRLGELTQAAEAERHDAARGREAAAQALQEASQRLEDMAASLALPAKA